jgi:hypothetical protein
VILKVLRGDIARICHVQAFSVALHAVARNAGTRLFGTLLVDGPARTDAHYRKNAQAYKGKNLASGSHSDRGTDEKHYRQSDSQYDQCY